MQHHHSAMFNVRLGRCAAARRQRQGWCEIMGVRIEHEQGGDTPAGENRCIVGRSMSVGTWSAQCASWAHSVYVTKYCSVDVVVGLSFA